MKKIYTILFFTLSITSFAQLVPLGFNYQATIRNIGGALLINQAVTFEVRVIRNSDTFVVFSESHNALTDDLGHVNFVIGSGTDQNGFITNINYYGPFSVNIKLNTGAGMIDMGSAPLQSVPFALNSINALYAGNGYLHRVGDLYQGGIIVSVRKSTDGMEHGLIMSLNDLGIVNHTDAVTLCENYTNDFFDDWRLPSIVELRQCLNNIYITNEVTEVSPLSSTHQYWTSTQDSLNPTTYYIDGFLYLFTPIPDPDNVVYRVRAVRSF